MSSWEPVDIDRDEIPDEDNKWDDDVMKDLESRFNQLRQLNETLNESHDEELIDMTTSTKDALKRDTIELVANQIYDKLTILLNKDRIRFGIQRGESILEPLRKYDNLISSVPFCYGFPFKAENRMKSSILKAGFPDMLENTRRRFLQ